MPLPEPDEDLPQPGIAIDARREDAHWSRAYWRERYYRADFDYEDYAPAYCVGYVGYAQYGGCYEEAERSLCANWVRIKGDSRLALEEALEAIRAAWTRVERMALESARPAGRGAVVQPAAHAAGPRSPQPAPTAPAFA